MNTELYNKIKDCNLEEILRRKGYVYFNKGKYNVNIIGVRHIKVGQKISNVFDDFIILEYPSEYNRKRHIYSATTKPGLTAFTTPVNEKGTGILVPGQYRAVYSVALHKGKYKALCQTNGPVKVYRDNNKNDIVDIIPEQIDEGYFGINIHRADKYNTSKYVNSWSAACQVIQDPKDFTSFMKIIEQAKNIYGNRFTYTLIEEKDII